MNNRRMVVQVGVFVLVGLVLAGVMVMRFSKGTGFSTTYKLNLLARNAAGIIPGAAILMAGVPVGSVSEIQLTPDGSRVTMVAQVYSRYQIASNAVFGIETVGFLGDRFVSVSPGTLKAGEPHPGFWTNNSVVQVREAFDITSVAQSAGNLMDRLGRAVEQLSVAVDRLDKTLLADESLTNLTATISNLRGVSQSAVSALGTIDSFLQTNTVQLSTGVTNFVSFTEKLNLITVELRETLATNRADLSAAMGNIESATERADRILRNVEEGKGLAGALLHNPEMVDYTSTLLSNAMVFSSNLNQKGFWGVFRKPKTKDK